MKSVSNQRLANLIQKEISNIIQFEMKEKHVGLVTITDVEVTSDLSHAYVYYSILDNPDRIEEDKANLKHAAGFIRTALSKKLSTYKCPKLVFRTDDSIERGNRIESILKEVLKEDENA